MADFPIIPGRIIELDGELHLIERVTFSAVLQRIESHRDKPGLSPTLPHENWTHSPAFRRLDGAIDRDGDPVDTDEGVIPIVPFHRDERYL